MQARLITFESKMNKRISDTSFKCWSNIPSKPYLYRFCRKFHDVMTKKVSVHRGIKSKEQRSKGGVRTKYQHVGIGNKVKVKKITRKSSQDTAKREVSRYKDYEDRIKKQSRNPHTRKPIIAPPTFQLPSNDSSNSVTQSIDSVDMEVNRKTIGRSKGKFHKGFAYTSSNVFTVLDEDQGNNIRSLQPPCIRPATFKLAEIVADASTTAT